MKNLNIKKTVLKTLVITSILISAFSCEKEDINISNEDHGDGQTKAAYATIGVMDADFEINNRGVIEISGGGAYFENCQWVYADPIATVIMPCHYPNGFCQTINVSGTPASNPNTGNNVLQEVALPGGGTTTTTPGLINSAFPCQTANMLKINLSEGNNPEIGGLMDQLKRDEVSIPDGETLESLAEMMLATFSIPNDATLSDQVTEDIRKRNPDITFGHITVLKGSYPITITKDQPNGFIHVLVTVNP